MGGDHSGTSGNRSAGPAHSAGSVGVFVLDDHEVIRRGLRLLLESDGVSVMGESSSAADAIRRIPALHPGLVIVDDDLPDGTGAEVCRAITVVDPGIRCVLLTSGAEEAVLIDAVLAGAWGCLSKQDDSAEQLRLIKRALAGHTAYSKRFQASSIAGQSRPGTVQTEVVKVNGASGS
ncbi:response regulator transcription factor [Arthrobacter sp. CAN_C5]|uniref:response regulator transcription factor n=1 Tax=Arthrobacter sp. CAN_C5 TaxID=2760706 RepID=UPI0037BF46C4